MRGWWRRNPYYRGYIVREASAFFVAAYALVLAESVLLVFAVREAAGHSDGALWG